MFMESVGNGVQTILRFRYVGPPIPKNMAMQAVFSKILSFP
jgi:hypothetical protein